jgi:hypothetical protein
MVNCLDIPERLTDKIPDWWSSKSDKEKWEFYKSTFNISVDLLEMMNQKQVINDELSKDLTESNNLLNKLWYAKYGLGVSALVGIDKTLSIDVYTKLDLYLYFLKGRGFVNLSAGIKIYDSLGGGLSLGVGFNW